MGINEKNCAAFYKMADYLSDTETLPKIKDYCTKMIKRNNVVDLFQYGEVFLDPIRQFIKKCHAELKASTCKNRNAKKLAEHTKLMDMSSFIKFCQACCSELSELLVRMVVSWLKHNESKEEDYLHVITSLNFGSVKDSDLKLVMDKMAQTFDPKSTNVLPIYKHLTNPSSEPVVDLSAEKSPEGEAKENEKSMEDVDFELACGLAFGEGDLDLNDIDTASTEVLFGDEKKEFVEFDDADQPGPSTSSFEKRGLIKITRTIPNEKGNKKRHSTGSTISVQCNLDKDAKVGDRNQPKKGILKRKSVNGGETNLREEYHRAIDDYEKHMKEVKDYMQKEKKKARITAEVRTRTKIMENEVRASKASSSKDQGPSKEPTNW